MEGSEEVIVKAAVEYLIHNDRPFEAALLLHAEFSYSISQWDVLFPMTGEGETYVATYTITLKGPPRSTRFLPIRPHSGAPTTS